MDGYSSRIHPHCCQESLFAGLLAEPMIWMLVALCMPSWYPFGRSPA